MTARQGLSVMTTRRNKKENKSIEERRRERKEKDNEVTKNKTKQN